MNVCVIIPAAGASVRFGEADKLVQDLGGRSLLLRTVELFAKRAEVGSIIVAGPPEPEAYEMFRERFAPTLGFHGARVIPGGRTARWETVRAALAEVPDDATHVAVHDAARPGADAKLLDRVFEAAQSHTAVVPAVPVAGTLKRVEAEPTSVAPPEDDLLADAILGDSGRTVIAVHRVTETIDRTGLVEIQTPQIFEVALLRRAYAEAECAGATDDAMIVERLGESVWTVEGDPRNLKVTTPADLVLMRAVLNVKPPAERPVHKRF